MDSILVIMPVYNTSKYLERAIDSVLQQKDVEVDLIIIDDASTDNSWDIITSKYKEYPNVAILQNKENRGAYYSRNKGLEALKEWNYDYFTVHDSDDISDLNRFKTILKQFKSNPKLLGVKSTYIRVDGDLKPIISPQGLQDIYASEGIAIFKRKVFEILGYYDNTRFSGDTDYWWRLEMFCNEFDKYETDNNNSILYLAIKRNEGLTSIKPPSERGEYYQKIEKEIKDMILKNNFYREKYE